MSYLAEDESERFAHIALTAPDGMEQWKRRVHARCNPQPADGLGPIRCPWCDDEQDDDDE